jgi:hypothetical protein
MNGDINVEKVLGVARRYRAASANLRPSVLSELVEAICEPSESASGSLFDRQRGEVAPEMTAETEQRIRSLQTALKDPGLTGKSRAALCVQLRVLRGHGERLFTEQDYRDRP